MEYRIPNLGTVWITRIREIPGSRSNGWSDRVEYAVTANDDVSGDVRSFMLLPTYWDERRVFAVACTHVNHEVRRVLNEHEDETNWWDIAQEVRDDVYASQPERFRMSGYMVVPYTYDNAGTRYDDLDDVQDKWTRGLIMTKYPDPGDTLDVYKTGDDEPTMRFTMYDNDVVVRDNW